MVQNESSEQTAESLELYTETISMISTCQETGLPKSKSKSSSSASEASSRSVVSPSRSAKERSGATRAERVREDHGTSEHLRPRGDRRRQDPPRRRDRELSEDEDLRPSREAPARVRLPELRPVAPHDGQEEHRVLPEGVLEGGEGEEDSKRHSSSSGSLTSADATRRS